MKNKYWIILYVFILLLILSGLALFIFHNSILNSFQTKINASFSTPVSSKIASSSEILDSSALESPRFKTLVNNVINFDFNNICWRPDAKLSQPAAGAATSSAPSCVQGNNIPFKTKQLTVSP